MTVDMRPAENGGLQITVTDEGIGMTPEEIIRAFAPFGQADSSLTRDHEGAGLGLTLASALTRSMDGLLELDSTPGTGTRVTMLFPPARSVASPAPTVTVQPAVSMWVAG